MRPAPNTSMELEAKSPQFIQTIVGMGLGTGPNKRKASHKITEMRKKYYKKVGGGRLVHTKNSWTQKAAISAKKNMMEKKSSGSVTGTTTTTMTAKSAINTITTTTTTSSTPISFVLPMDVEEDDIENKHSTGGTSATLGRTGRIHPIELKGSHQIFFDVFKEETKDSGKPPPTALIEMKSVKSCSYLCPLNEKQIQLLLNNCRNIQYNDGQKFIRFDLTSPIAKAKLFINDGKFVVEDCTSVKRNALATRIIARRIQKGLLYKGVPPLALFGGEKSVEMSSEKENYPLVIRNFHITNVTGVYDPENVLQPKLTSVFTNNTNSKAGEKSPQVQTKTPLESPSTVQEVEINVPNEIQKLNMAIRMPLSVNISLCSIPSPSPSPTTITTTPIYSIKETPPSSHRRALAMSRFALNFNSMEQELDQPMYNHIVKMAQFDLEFNKSFIQIILKDPNVVCKIDPTGKMTISGSLNESDIKTAAEFLWPFILRNIYVPVGIQIGSHKLSKNLSDLVVGGYAQ